MGEKRSAPWDWQYSQSPSDWRLEHWKKVASPAARRVIRAAHSAIPLGTHRGPALDDPEKCPLEIHEYQQWLRERLAASGLAKALAGGPAYLPDVSEHLPRPWRYLAQLFAPRTVEQLTRKVAGNLEWYVDQSRPVKDPWKLASRLALPTLFCTALVEVPLVLTTNFRSEHFMVMLGLTLILWAIIFAVSMAYGKGSHKHRTNCAELYEYLLKEYSEPAEDAVPSDAPQLQRYLQGLTRLSRLS